LLTGFGTAIALVHVDIVDAGRRVVSKIDMVIRVAGIPVVEERAKGKYFRPAVFDRFLDPGVEIVIQVVAVPGRCDGRDEFHLIDRE
jgi:hypothetical protein